MDNAFDTRELTSTTITDYERPELTVIGCADDVILGWSDAGFDGYDGYAEPAFEFELDE